MRMTPRVVVVDDRPMMRLFVRNLLEELGYELAGEASNGAEGVEEVAKQRPDVVVMDWEMPVMNGLDATVRIKRADPAVSVVAFTSTDDDEVKEGFLSAGVCDYVTKGAAAALRAALERCAPA
jgi:CheY-like chemotaxis protein